MRALKLERLSHSTPKSNNDEIDHLLGKAEADVPIEGLTSSLMFLYLCSNQINDLKPIENILNH